MPARKWVSAKVFPLLISGPGNRPDFPRQTRECRGPSGLEDRTLCTGTATKTKVNTFWYFTASLGFSFPNWEQWGWPRLSEVRALPAIRDHTALAPQCLSGLTQTCPTSLPLLCIAVLLKVCLSLDTPGSVTPQAPPKHPVLQGLLRPGLGTHLICRLQLGVKLAEDLLQVLADHVGQHIQPAPGARESWALTWCRGHHPQ